MAALTNRHYSLSAWWGFLLTVLWGCTAVPPLERPESPTPLTNTGLKVEDAWWLAFKDDVLNQLIETGRQQNLDLKVSLARLKQSQAIWDAAGSAHWPTLNGHVQRSSTQSQSSAGITDTSQQWQLGLSASYELDFWGRIDAGDTAAEWGYYASQANHQVLQNTVAAQIARSWFGWLLERQKVELLLQQQQWLETGLKVIEGRFARGKVSVSDVWQQKQLIESVKGDLNLALRRERLHTQSLNVWLGGQLMATYPQLFLPPIPVATAQQAAISTPFNAALLLPELHSLPTAIASDALQSRPDVMAAYYTLQQSNAQLAVAVSNRYPRFTLSASYTAADSSLADVLDNWTTQLIAGLVMPLIDGGSLRAKVRQQEAALEAELLTYQQTLLEAAQEVEGAMVNDRQQFHYYESIRIQLRLSRQTYDLLDQRYRKGLGDYLNLLTAQQNLLQLQRRVLEAQWQHVDYRVQFFQALSTPEFRLAQDDRPIPLREDTARSRAKVSNHVD